MTGSDGSDLPPRQLCLWTKWGRQQLGQGTLHWGEHHHHCHHRHHELKWENATTGDTTPRWYIISIWSWIKIGKNTNSKRQIANRDTSLRWSSWIETTLYNSHHQYTVYSIQYTWMVIVQGEILTQITLLLFNNIAQRQGAELVDSVLENFKSSRIRIRSHNHYCATSGSRVGRLCVGCGEEGVWRLRLPSGLMVIMVEMLIVVEMVVVVEMFMVAMMVDVVRKESEGCDCLQVWSALAVIIVLSWSWSVYHSLYDYHQDRHKDRHSEYPIWSSAKFSGIPACPLTWGRHWLRHGDSPHIKGWPCYHLCCHLRCHYHSLKQAQVNRSHSKWRLSSYQRLTFFFSCNYPHLRCFPCFIYIVNPYFR